MKLSNWMVGFVLFAGVITGMTFIIADMNANYNIEFTDNASYQVLDELRNITSQIEDQTDASNIDSTNFFEKAAKGATAGTKLTGLSMKTFRAVFAEFSNALGVPSWVSVVVAILVTILITFAIISALQRWNT